MAKRELGLHLLIKIRCYAHMMSCCDDLMTEGMRLWMQIDWNIYFPLGDWLLPLIHAGMQGEDVCDL